MVSWTPSADNSGNTSFVVTLSPGSLTCTSTSTGCTISNLTPGTSYQVSVAATNAQGTSTPATGTLNVPATPQAVSPTTVTARLGTGVHQIVVSWDAVAGASSYTVMSSPTTRICVTTNTWCIVSTYTAGTIYTFKVSARVGTVLSAPTHAAPLTTPGSSPHLRLSVPRTVKKRAKMVITVHVLSNGKFAPTNAPATLSIGNVVLTGVIGSGGVVVFSITPPTKATPITVVIGSNVARTTIPPHA